MHSRFGRVPCLGDILREWLRPLSGALLSSVHRARTRHSLGGSFQNTLQSFPTSESRAKTRQIARLLAGEEDDGYQLVSLSADGPKQRLNRRAAICNIPLNSESVS